MAAQYSLFDSLENTDQCSINEPAEILPFTGRKEASLQKALQSMASTPEGGEAIIQMACQLIDEKLAKRKVRITKPDDSGRYFKARLGDLDHEAFAVLFMDSSHNVLGFEVLFRGTIDSASIYPREVVKEALRYNAAAVILGHNHPSGNSSPSQADLTLTRRLKEALALVDIRTLDHMVVGRGAPYSFAENGQM